MNVIFNNVKDSRMSLPSDMTPGSMLAALGVPDINCHYNNDKHTVKVVEKIVRNGGLG